MDGQEWRAFKGHMTGVMLTMVSVRAETLVMRPASARLPTLWSPRAEPIQRMPAVAVPSLTPGVGALL